MSIAFSGDMMTPGEDGKVREHVTITGRTTKKLHLRVVAWESTAGEIRFEYADIAPCPETLGMPEYDQAPQPAPF